VLKAYGLLLIAQLSYSVNVVISKDAMELIPVYSLCGLRYGMSTFLFLIFCLMRRPPLMDSRHPEGKLTSSDYTCLLAQGLSGGFIFNILFYLGLKSTTATSAGIISASLPAFMALFAFLFLKEQITGKKQIAIFLSMAGIVALSMDNTHEPSTAGTWMGDSLILLAMLPEALYTIFSSKVRGRVTTLAAATIANGITFLLFIPFILWEYQATWESLTPKILGIVALGGLASFLFFWCWSTALQTIPASTAGLFGGLLPVLTACMAVVFLGEWPQYTDFLGMGLVIFSIFLGR
jgi:drug/metabolite transporter (DMT)-like permease